MLLLLRNAPDDQTIALTTLPIGIHVNGLKFAGNRAHMPGPGNGMVDAGVTPPAGYPGQGSALPAWTLRM